jgi:TRAP-type mannitol/chloroaromatic compound transport system substrate-binding protein
MTLPPHLLRYAAVAALCLVGGAALGRFVLLPDAMTRGAAPPASGPAAPGPTAAAPPASVPPAGQPPGGQPPAANGPPAAPPRPDTVFLKWRVQSAFPLDLPQYGTIARRFADQLRRAAGGNIQIDIEEPGKLVPTEKCLEEAGRGKVDACWSSPFLWAQRDSAMALFAGHPFGPEAAEYLAWLRYGGGQALIDETYQRAGAKALICGLTAADAGGWFRRPIQKADDLRGLKVRSQGLAARVYAKAGAEARHLEGAAMLTALKDGAIDGVEFSMPAIDVAAGFHTLVTHYHFPGWQRPTTAVELVMSRRLWDQLPDGTRALIEAACAEALREGIAEGEAIQARALRELRARGVALVEYTPEVLAALRRAWLDVVAEESAADPGFKKVWTSFAAFRAEYDNWRRLKSVPVKE